MSTYIVIRKVNGIERRFTVVARNGADAARKAEAVAAQYRKAVTA
ncbi:MAG TPA: hypothetical protein VK088_08845 [Acidimicrobiia bacterium]|nr:hypothetical protein [Acidimicrobiia bacterium]